VDERQSTYRQIWKTKPVLREIYQDYYRRIVTASNTGPTLEIGGGSGNLKEFAPDVISIDILQAPWLDTVADAQSLPFVSGHFQNIVMLDVLHHIQYPRKFLTEAIRVLQSKGRLIIIEPAITPVSWFFYKLFHPEPINLYADPLEDGHVDARRDPYDANQAIPTLLVGRYRNKMEQQFPQLKLMHCEWLSFIAYPLSGGFRSWSLIPNSVIKPILEIENRLAPIFGHIMGFRLFIIIERSDQED
jgi:SAM-dependent methyltransferase